MDQKSGCYAENWLIRKTEVLNKEWFTNLDFVFCLSDILACNMIWETQLNYLSNKCLAVKQSTGILKNASVWGEWISTVTT